MGEAFIAAEGSRLRFLPLGGPLSFFYDDWLDFLPIKFADPWFEALNDASGAAAFFFG